MNSRERIFRALNHEKSDRIPFDLAGNTWTGITKTACLNLAQYLDYREHEPEWSDVIQQIVFPFEKAINRSRTIQGILQTLFPQSIKIYKGICLKEILKHLHQVAVLYLVQFIIFRLK